MKREVQRYKKAAKSLRSFHGTMRKYSDLFQGTNDNETVENRRKYWDDLQAMRAQLDRTLGKDALTALYFEGTVDE